MAAVTGTFQTYDAIGNREDLEDVVYNISPEDTPLVSLIGSTKVSATRHEWQIDTLRAPASNAQIEGDEFTFEAKDPTERVANFTQIASDTLVVSATQDVVDKAGRDRETAYQLAKMGKEIRKDVELACVSNIGSSAGTSSTGRVAAGFPAWITSNAVRGTGGANGGFNSGTGLVSAATNGTQVALSKDMLDDAIQATYEAGGKPTVFMVSPFHKRAFSGLINAAGTAEWRYAANMGKQTIIAAADVYLSDFGEISVVPNRVMGTSPATARNAFLIDPEMISRGVLRPMRTHKLAKTGDAEKHAIVTEFTLIVKNEAAHAVIADLTTS